MLIKRADREGDPWSGDVAFPGGRVDSEDESFRGTAEREAHEEVDIDLSTHARFLGYMDPFQSGRKGIWVVPSLFMMSRAVSVGKSGEVSSHMWVPLRTLVEPESRSTFTLEAAGDGRSRSFPAFNVKGYVVWGLTERVLSSLIDRVASN